MSRSLTNRLHQARRTRQQRTWLALLLLSLIGAAAVLLLSAAIDRFWPMQEATAFAVLAIFGSLWLILLAAVTYFVWFRPHSLPDLAAEVEKQQPEWMDALICAVEQEQKPADQRRPLEQALVARTRERTKELDFTALLVPPYGRAKPLLAGAVAAILLIAGVAFTTFARKGGYHLADLLSGQSSGLRVTPGHGETPVRTNVTIEAEVLRWNEHPEIEYIDRDGNHRFPMHRGEEGHEFTLYDLPDDVTYRIRTPSLRSPWYRIETYVPPNIEGYEILVQPPAYTGLPKEELDELNNLKAVEGSRIEWRLTAPAATRASLRTPAGDLPLEREEDGRHRIAIDLEETFVGRFVVEDEAGRSARTPEFRVQARPDHPPTIEITRPGQDIQAAPDERVAVAALAADDFGLTNAELHVSLSGDRQPARKLFKVEADGEPPFEEALRTAIDLVALEAKEGDVVSYFITARDNREPEARQARSEVFFIEVREEVEPMEMEGDPMELDQIDLQALIVELKRLIRQSWDTASRDDARAERQVAAALEEVRLETARVQQSVIEQAGEEEAQPLVDRLEEAMRRMEAASSLLQQRVVEDSIPHQERALAHLVAIQTELMKNQATSSEPPEEGSPGPSGSPPQTETVDDDTAEELQRMIREVQRMADNQAAQNSALRRLGSRGLDEQQQEEFRRRQETLREQAVGLNGELSRMPGSEAARRDLGAATGSMERAGEQIGGNRPERAAREGDRARSSLLSAVETLQDALAQATSNQIAQLARQAEQLSGGQGEAAGSSRELAAGDASREEAAAARQQQQSLQERLQALLSEIDATAGQLRQDHPDAARAIAEAGQEMRDANVPGEMTRAANALLYRRFERAAEMQDAAAGELGGLAQALNDSASLMPAMSREQMQQLLSQIERSQQELMEMTGQAPDQIQGRLEEMAARLGERLSRAGRALNDPSLQELAGALRGGDEGQQNPNIFRMDSMLRAAGRALEQQLFALEMERWSRLQRQVSEPPEKYRGLVEEYFRSLSERP